MCSVALGVSNSSAAPSLVHHWPAGLGVGGPLGAAQSSMGLRASFYPLFNEKQFLSVKKMCCFYNLGFYIIANIAKNCYFFSFPDLSANVLSI